MILREVLGCDDGAKVVNFSFEIWEIDHTHNIESFCLDKADLYWAVLAKSKRSNAVQAKVSMPKGWVLEV
jgi:hypothetical protein